MKWLILVSVVIGGLAWHNPELARALRESGSALMAATKPAVQAACRTVAD